MDPHAFLDCAKQHQWEAIKQALNSAPELVNVQPAGRWSALHQAAQADDLRAVEMLLRFRADPLVKTRDGETPRGVAVGDEVRGVLMAAEEAGLVARRRRTKAPPPEVPRSFTKNFALIVEVSPIVGDRSAPYTAGADTKAIIEGLAVAMTDPGAVECYGLDGVKAQQRELAQIIVRGLTGSAALSAGPAPLQLQKNIIAAYTAETFFGGHGHSVLNTSLRNLKEYPPLAPAASLLHFAVSELAASDEYGYDGEAFRAMRLPDEVIRQYMVHRDTKLNLFAWSGFTSCTRDPGTCLGFVDEWELNVVFRIASGGRRLRPMRIEEWSQIPEEKEVLYDLGQQFELTAVERTTRDGAAMLLGVGGGGGGDADEVVVLTIKAVDRFNDLVTDVFKDGGDVNEALRVCTLRAEREVRRHGAESLEAGKSYNNMASVYNDQGEYTKALEYYEKSLRIRLAALGPEHPDVGASYNGMASVYIKQGEYGKALEYYEKSLRIRLLALGPEHPDVGDSYNNMANVYAMQGEHIKALEYYEKSLRIRLLALGPEHPDVGASYNNMASVYDDQGEHGKALEYYEKSLKIRLAALGPEHPKVGASYNNMASVFDDQGEYTKALEYYEKSLRIRLAALGPEHPSTLDTEYNMAHVYRKQGQRSKARSLFVRCAEGYAKRYGADHSETKDARKQAALCD